MAARVLRLWFGLHVPVSRQAYLTTGFGLMGFKYLAEALVVYALTKHVWMPADYLVPSLERFRALNSSALSWGLAIWTLPFIWIGASMTVRRALDAGLSAGWGLLFFIPFVNYLVMLVLAGLPHRAASDPAGVPPAPSSAVRSAFAGVLVGALIVVAALIFGSQALRAYGTALFLGTPFVVGFAASSLFNARAVRSVGATIGLAFVTIVAASGVVLASALEGVLCLLMAFPLALALAMVGALLARQISKRGQRSALPFVLLGLGLPTLMGASAGTPPPLREVVSGIDVAAPPDTVWRNVIAFGELPPPAEWLFRAGVAYPLRARIDGRSVGAVRRCEFSTGAFVEPITVWDPPRRLSFDVREQPDGMRELSPYDHVSAPHVSGYLTSKRGEFRLRPRPGGGTRLEGSTFYTLDIFPTWYWSRYADAIIGQIHMRVLRHIKALSERSSR